MGQQALFLDHLDRCQRRRARHRVAAITARGRDGFEHLHVRLTDRHGGHREPVAESLAQRDYVGQYVPMLHAHPFTGPSHAGEHFIGHQQDLVLVAQLPQFREEIIRRDHRPTPPLDGFQHKGRHLPGRRPVQVFLVELDVLVRVNRTVGLGPVRPVGIRPRHHVRTGYPGGSIHAGPHLGQ